MQKKKKRNPAKQRLYFQSTNYNLTLFDCVSNYSAFTEMLQHEITMDLDSFWGRFSAALNTASAIKATFKLESTL